MSDVAFADFERKVEELPLLQLYRLRNKIDLLISHPETEKRDADLPPVTSRLLGVARFDGVYDEILEESIGDKWV